MKIPFAPSSDSRTRHLVIELIYSSQISIIDRPRVCRTIGEKFTAVHFVRAKSLAGKIYPRGWRLRLPAASLTNFPSPEENSLAGMRLTHLHLRSGNLETAWPQLDRNSAGYIEVASILALQGLSQCQAMLIDSSSFPQLRSVPHFFFLHLYSFDAIESFLDSEKIKVSISKIRPNFAVILRVLPFDEISKASR